MGMRPVFRAVNAPLPGISSLVSLEISATAKTAVFGPQKLKLIDAIAGKVVDKEHRISFPGIGADLWPSQAIQFVSFGQKTSSNAQAPFVGARYESFRDEFDLDLRAVLRAKAPQDTTDSQIAAISEELDLQSLMSHWYVGLSNGQSRRAQLAQALLRKPRLLVMDEPFLGLDPINRSKFGNILAGLPIPVVIGLRGGDKQPSWINQTVYASEGDGVLTGRNAVRMIEEQRKSIEAFKELKKQRRNDRDMQGAVNSSGLDTMTPLIEMKDLTVRYKGAKEPIFRNFNLIVNDGEIVHIKGANGSGKSTLLALVTADHPQTWANDIRIMGERLKVGKHSYFSLNKLIGHTSPEIHAIFPRYLNTKRAISTAFSGSMIPPSRLTEDEENQIEDIAKRLHLDLKNPTRFGELNLSDQKLILLARAVVKRPRILILDEALSTLNALQIERAFDLLSEFTGAILVVGHVDEEVPASDKVVDLSRK